MQGGVPPVVAVEHGVCARACAAGLVPDAAGPRSPHVCAWAGFVVGTANEFAFLLPEGMSLPTFWQDQVSPLFSRCPCACVPGSRKSTNHHHTCMSLYQLHCCLVL